MKIEIDDVQPTDNRLYARAGHGRRFLSKEGKEWKKLVNLKASKYKPDDKRYKVEIKLTFPDRRVRDATNYQKITLDALEGRVYHNDTQIFDIRIRKRIHKGKKKTVIKWEEIEVEDEGY